MQARIKKGIAAAAAVVAAAAAIFIGNAGSAAGTAPSLQAFGLIGDGTTMCAFKTDRPGTLDWVMDVQGLVGDTRLIGIDFRVQDGLLYGVGDSGGIYTIQFPPNRPDVLVTKVSQLTVALYGTSFGVDFNPAADRLRVISDNGQNLRHNLNDHTTTVDGLLNLNGVLASGVTAAAYTNNDLNGDTATTLFDVDTVNNQVAIQAPPNNGILNPTGKLGVDASLNAGFDIFSDLSVGKTITNTAFGAFIPLNSRASFYMVDVLTGAATKVGDFPSIAPVNEVAVMLDTN
jgi:hypothetical protein